MSEQLYPGVRLCPVLACVATISAYYSGLTGVHGFHLACLPSVSSTRVPEDVRAYSWQDISEPLALHVLSVSSFIEGVKTGEQ